MKDNTILLFQDLYCNIRDKLNPEERDKFKNLIDSLTWEKYQRDDVYGFCGRYNICLVDGTIFDDDRVAFRFNDQILHFETESEISHPQVKIRINKIRDKTTYCIPDNIVKYIR